MLCRVDLTFPPGFSSCYLFLCQVAPPVSAECRRTSSTLDVYVLIINVCVTFLIDKIHSSNYYF